MRCIKEGNSIIVIYYTPQNNIPLLLVEAQENLHNLINMGVIKLTIAFHTTWDKRTRDKVKYGYCTSNNVFVKYIIMGLDCMRTSH